MVLIIALICYELVWTEGERELSEVKLGRRSAEDVPNQKKLILSKLFFYLVPFICPSLPTSLLFFLGFFQFVHSVAATYSLTSPWAPLRCYVTTALSNSIDAALLYAQEDGGQQREGLRRRAEKNEVKYVKKGSKVERVVREEGCVKYSELKRWNEGKLRRKTSTGSHTFTVFHLILCPCVLFF